MNTFLGKFLTILLVICFGVVNCIKWEDASSSSGSDILNRNDVVSGGKEVQLVTTYVCRASIDGRWVPGKLIVTNGKDAYCYVTESDEVHQYDRFQILAKGNKYPWWVAPPNRHTAPRYAVVGGHHPSGETAYICRVKISGTDELIIGKHSERDGACYYGWS